MMVMDLVGCDNHPDRIVRTRVRWSADDRPRWLCDECAAGVNAIVAEYGTEEPSGDDGETLVIIDRWWS